MDESPVVLYHPTMRYSRAKPVGSFRVYHPSSRTVGAHAETLKDARADAGFFTRASSATVEIQERFPSGAWVTVETVTPESRTSTKKRAHAEIKAAPVESGPTKENLQRAAKWIRRELTKRADSGHPSHLASKVLAEADEKFKLESFGVEGWAKSPSRGYQYLNYGDPYDATIVVRSNPTRATVIVALGGWASYAGNE